MPIRTIAAVAIALLAGTTLAFAAPATKDGAVAMVKNAVATIKAEGPEKAYAEFNKGGQYVDGELYVLVRTLDGVVLAHATNPKLVGKNLIDEQDVDGKYFSKDLGELGKKQASFWYDFKFVNPVTKKIQVKDLYCESLNQTIVCTGVYRL
jgi:cytochrome c